MTISFATTLYTILSISVLLLLAGSRQVSPQMQAYEHEHCQYVNVSLCCTVPFAVDYIFCKVHSTGGALRYVCFEDSISLSPHIRSAEAAACHQLV